MVKGLGQVRGGEPLTAPPLLPFTSVLMDVPRAVARSHQQMRHHSWSQAGLSKVSTSQIFSDWSAWQICSQSPGQSHPILGKQMNTIALSLSIRFYHSFQQSNNRWKMQLSEGRGVGGEPPMWQRAWPPCYSFSLSLSWHHFIIRAVCPSLRNGLNLTLRWG